MKTSPGFPFYELFQVNRPANTLTINILINECELLICVFLLLTGDRTTEEKVDETLLISFRHFFRWSGDPNVNSKPEIYSVNNYDMTVGIRINSKW